MRASLKRKKDGWPVEVYSPPDGVANARNVNLTR
jgi:hypothetical protein